MLIVEENHKKTNWDNRESEDELREDYEKYRKNKDHYEKPTGKIPKKRKHYCWKSCGCLILFLIVIGLIVYGAYFFIIGPVVTAVDNLPSDFPKELVLYNTETAEIKVQTPEDKDKLQSILNILPEWLSAPFIKAFSTDIKTQFVKAPNELGAIPKINIEGIKNYLQNSDLKNSKTVSANWKEIDRKKEELSDYYRKQLVNNGFVFKENISDYDINLEFWKDEIFGIINIKDSFGAEDESDANITINY